MTTYKSGTIDLTNGSAVITGNGTQWASAILSGDLLTLDWKEDYEVLSVDSDTQLTLSRNFAGTTALAQSYAIKRVSLSHQSTSRIAIALVDLKERLDGMINVTGADRVLTLDRAAETDDAFLQFRTNGDDRWRFGVIGNDTLVLQRSEDGTAFATVLSFDRSTGAIDLNASQIGNDSGVTGSDVKAALNTLSAAVSNALKMTNMVEGADAKILTSAERSKIAGAGLLAGDNNWTGINSFNGTDPYIQLKDTNGPTTHNTTRLYNSGNSVLFQTRDDAGNYVSNDYLISRGATGALIHSFRVANSNRVTVSDGGLTCYRDIVVEGSATNTDPRIFVYSEDGLRSSWYDIRDIAPTEVRFEKVSASGTSVMRLETRALDNTSDVYLTLWRNTNTTGGKRFFINRGDGSSTVDHYFRSGNTGQLVSLCQNGGYATVNGSQVLTAGDGDVINTWVTFNGTGTPSISGSKNVSSITDNGVGDYTINFSNNLPSVNYCPVISAAASEAAPAIGNLVRTIPSIRSVSSFRFGTANAAGTALVDCSYINVQIAGG